jgi:ribosomal protein L12E/L44/L45/RPP1/RPP2
MAATATQLVRNVWASYFAVAEAKEQAEADKAAAAAEAAKEVEEDPNEEEEEGGLLGCWALPSAWLHAPCLDVSM